MANRSKMPLVDFRRNGRAASNKCDLGKKLFRTEPPRNRQNVYRSATDFANRFKLVCKRSLCILSAVALICCLSAALGNTRARRVAALFDCVLTEISLNFNPLRFKFVSSSVLIRCAKCAASGESTVRLSVVPAAVAITTKRFRRSGTASISTSN